VATLSHTHPHTIIIFYSQAITVDLQDKNRMSMLVQSTIGTKFSSRWNDKMVEMALEAVLTVSRPSTTGGKMTEVDIKRYAKVEKIPGGEITDCQVLKGVMFHKDVTHSKMRRTIQNPRILLLDSPLEYKKGESQTNMEITQEEDWNAMLKMEEEFVENMCMEIIAFRPDIVITEKGVSDLAQHYLQKANITAFRRLRKTDNNRIARAVGATIVSRTDEIQETDIGTHCGLFEMRKIGEEWFCFLVECQDPKACTIVLRGGSKDVLNEIERNLDDAMKVVRNVVYQPKLLPGGGATEMAVAMGLRRAGTLVQGIQQGPFQAVGDAMEVIPRTLAQNCGVSVIRTVTALRAKHAAAYDANPDGQCHVGINGTTGDIVDMEELGIWEPFSVKTQTIKTAIESACMILYVFWN
jgi:T-complex protein 1 subunit gamma